MEYFTLFFHTLWTPVYFTLITGLNSDTKFSSEILISKDLDFMKFTLKVGLHTHIILNINKSFSVTE